MFFLEVLLYALPIALAFNPTAHAFMPTCNNDATRNVPLLMRTRTRPIQFSLIDDNLRRPPTSNWRLYSFFNFQKWVGITVEEKKEENDEANRLSEDILKYAHDPILFEKAVMEQRKKEQEQKVEAEIAPKKPYQRIEDWEAEKKKKMREGMSWEERVQYEGQRYGDQYKQNEILRQNLKSF